MHMIQSISSTHYLPHREFKKLSPSPNDWSALLALPSGRILKAVGPNHSDHLNLSSVVYKNIGTFQWYCVC